MLVSESTVSIEGLVNQIFSSRKITRSDQRVLMSLLLSKNDLSLEEHSYIDQVFERLRRGLIHVVD
ncbi:hypothetical protein PCC9214_01182 [Planktothrix tepida]|uniref:Uncharacterized protein n=2 Tax=Planktothrix TaxID=54304 RepID=A0A1J1LFV8_9CYAN|nr:MULTISPECIES: hypothetical protein [Planktothrix]CAD5929417.1 hypothetical protein PCC9214_01182 [Planktothrix tepida]CAD5979962.1 hypothetical protein NO713_04600 [Planktothrix pseudagardhii]CUR31479.1 conserved hypothetical protein [Planktothrix tepida PCC 9214]